MILLKFEEVSLLDNKLRKESLTTADVFLVHGQKLFLWIGKAATLHKKTEAMKHAVNYFKTVRHDFINSLLKR